MDARASGKLHARASWGDHLWPFVVEDPEWMELFGQERFGLLPIADHHNLSNDEVDLLAEGRVPFEEAIGELNKVLQGKE